MKHKTTTLTRSKSASHNGELDNDTNTQRKPTRIAYEKWFAKYRPIKNHFDKNASYEGCLFETYGKEVEFVSACNPKKVWTLVDCDGKAQIVEGIHFVNRLGYFITEAEAPENRTFFIKGD